MEDTRRAMLTKMLTDRMRFARWAAEEWVWELNDHENEGGEYRGPVTQAADEEVRDCIREIARACHFENDCVDEITSVAWSKSKEDA